MSNRLATALSPYLRQHADNPVDWWEWGPEALAEAARRDVPVFLSIGYAACHWCHVMAHESFEDPRVAELLNARFVPVKVDREERPDVDAIYMDVTVALTGQGGWPMSVWLTPEGHAFHAGTYFPPVPRRGVPSFTQVLDAIGQAWQERREQVAGGAASITSQLAARALPPDPGGVTAADVDQAVGQLVAQHDDLLGGFGDAPKFPPSTILDALVRRAAQADGPVADQAWQIAVITLEKMARGGIYDQLGGGFARYAVDRAWVVPHFEKMLYDNALLIGAYARASAEAHRRGAPVAAAMFERVVDETVAWLLREMATPEGGFAASLDADSPDGTDGTMREGAFYTWSIEQLVQALGHVDGDLAARELGVGVKGNVEADLSTLQLSTDPDDPIWFAGIRERLRTVRDERTRPARDDKVVAAWNGWLIASLVDAAMLLDRPAWLEPAAGAADLLRCRHVGEGRLARVSLGNRVSPAPGTAEDYAAVAHGFLTLAAATGDGERLADALALLHALDEHFTAPDGGLFDTADGDQLVRRPRNLAENATPSSSTAALTAYRVAYRLTGDDHWRGRADAISRTLGTIVVRVPRAAGWALADAIAEAGGRRPAEVAVVGPAGETRAALVHAAWREAPPGSVIAVGDLPAEASAVVPLLADRGTLGGDPTAYVCHDQVCDLPVTALADLRARLG